MATYFHGTTSTIAQAIVEEGFKPGSYFTTSVDDAIYYAATGGESDLQLREEAWEEENGSPPREEYGPELWLMFEHLYPDEAHPAILVVDIPVDICEASTPDTGAEGSIRIPCALPSDFVMRMIPLEWELLSRDGLDPLACLDSDDHQHGSASPVA